MTAASEPQIPAQLLSALRLGRMLAVEVAATTPERRAWVSVHPQPQPEDEAAQREGWTRSDLDRVFRVRRTEYDAGQVDGYDYDLGREYLADVTVTGEPALLILLASWDIDPAQLAPAWRTDWPE